jgi:hypothetical protein
MSITSESDLVLHFLNILIAISLITVISVETLQYIAYSVKDHYSVRFFIYTSLHYVQSQHLIEL